MAKLSLKSVLGSKPPSNYNENAVDDHNQSTRISNNGNEIQQQFDNSREMKRLQLQNRQLAIRNEKLLQQVAVLQNEMSNTHQQLAMIRNREARMKGSFRKSIGAIRRTIISKFEDLMAQFDSDVDQLGIGYERSIPLPIGYHEIHSMDTRNFPLDPAGYLKGMNDYIHKRLDSVPKSQTGTELTVYSQQQEGETTDKDDNDNDNDKTNSNSKEDGEGAAIATTCDAIQEEDQADGHAFQPIAEENGNETSSDESPKLSEIASESQSEDTHSENSTTIASKWDETEASNINTTGATSMLTSKNDESKEVKLLPAPYKDSSDDVPQKKEPVSLSPLGESITKNSIPVLSFSEKDEELKKLPQSPEKPQMPENTEENVVKETHIIDENENEIEKTNTSYSSVEDSDLDLMDGMSSGDNQFDNESIQHDEDDDRNGVTNVPLTENPFKDPDSKIRTRIVRTPKKKQQGKKRKRLSGLSRELKNLQFEMPLSWRDDGGEKPRKLEKRRDSLLDSDLENKEELDDLSSADIDFNKYNDNDYKEAKVDVPDPVEVMAANTRRKNLFKDGPLSKKRRVADYGKSSRKLQVLNDVTNNLDRNSSGNSSRRHSKKKGGSIFDLLDEDDGNTDESNKENVVPSGNQSKNVRQTTKRRRKHKNKKLVTTAVFDVA